MNKKFALLLTLVLVAFAAPAFAAPVLLINETWNGPSSGNGPLGQASFADPHAHLALDATSGAPFVSANDYIFTGNVGAQTWAFTVDYAAGGTFDFTQGPNDLQFRKLNSSGQFHVILGQVPGGGYAISDTAYGSGGWTNVTVDLDATTWKSIDIPTMTVGAAVVPDFSRIQEVGFARTGTSGTERIDDVKVTAERAASWFTIHETFNEPRGSGTYPLAQDQLVDPNARLALDATGGGPFMSYNDYIYTGSLGSGTWAFSLGHRLPGVYFDFTHSGEDLQFRRSNNAGGEFQIVLAQSDGGDYVISDQVFGAGGWSTIGPLDLDAMTWQSLDLVTMTPTGAVTPDFSRIWEVGFASNATTAAERIDDIYIQAMLGVPEPSTLALLGLAGMALVPLARRRRK